MSCVPRDLAASATISFGRWTLSAAETIYSFRSKRTVAKHKQYLPSIRDPYVLFDLFRCAAHLRGRFPEMFEICTFDNELPATCLGAPTTASLRKSRPSPKINFLKTNNVFFIFRVVRILIIPKTLTPAFCSWSGLFL